MDILSINRLTTMFQEKPNVSNNSNKNRKPFSGLPADEVVLSSTAQEFSQILKEIKNYPEIRETKIKELSDKIDSGSYHVDSAKIADALLNYSKL